MASNENRELIAKKFGTNTNAEKVPSDNRLVAAWQLQKNKINTHPKQGTVTGKTLADAGGRECLVRI